MSLRLVDPRHSTDHLRDLLEVCLGYPFDLEINLTKEFPKRAGKRRPIRREFAEESAELTDCVPA